MSVQDVFRNSHVTKGAFNLPRNSGNSGWDVNRTHVLRAQWKIPGNKWNFEKVVRFSGWKRFRGNARSIYEFCIANSMICSDIWHKYHERYFEIVIRNFTSC